MYGNLPFLVLNQLSMYVRRLTKQNQPIFIPNKKLCSQIKEDETSSTGLLSGGGKGENFMGYLGLVLFRTEVGGADTFLVLKIGASGNRGPSASIKGR